MRLFLVFSFSLMFMSKLVAMSKESDPSVDDLKLSYSVMVQTRESMLAGYVEVLKKSEEKKISFAKALVETHKNYQWPALVNLAYKNDKITSKDLWWVIEQYAYPKELNEAEAKTAFDIFIKIHLSNKSMSPLLTETNLLPNDGILTYCLNSISYYLYYPPPQDVHDSIISKLVELSYSKKYFEILTIIIDSLTPETLENEPIRRQKEYRNEQYHTRLYTLTGFLRRDKDYYLDKKQGRLEHYVSIAQWLTNRVRNNSTGRVTQPTIASLACFLNEQD